MLFNSLEFLLFFPVVTAVYFVCPLRARWWVLLIASAAFYMAFIPIYIVIILATIVVDYIAGIMIAASSGHRRRAYLVLSLVTNVGILSVFKYGNFVIDNMNALFSLTHVSMRAGHIGIALPIGLSFHTFQAMSYTIEVYRGRQEAERNFVVYALYVLFYPQLVAGPIERPQNIIHQLRTLHAFDGDRAGRGLRRMLIGFFKKCVVADRLALIVNAVYGAPSHFSGAVVLLATVAFSVQIYADFSGYSDIALGCAEVMGVRLMTNFRQPYCSSSVNEFWSRWHISLSTWFRDYLYIPLGGNRVSAWRRRLNVMITFTVSGLWHGANWNFVIWGALNGLFVLGSGEIAKANAGSASNARGRLRALGTFGLITFAWVFFRASTASEAFKILRRIGGAFGDFARPLEVVRDLAAVAIDTKRLLVTAVVAAILLTVDTIASRRRCDTADLLGDLPRSGRWATYYAIGAAMVVFGIYGRQQFIYFQF